MKLKLVIGTVMLLLIVSACSSISVRNDYDTEFDFDKFSTFKIVNKSNSKAESKLPISIEFNRISRAVEKELGAKGFSKKEIDPDFIVTFRTSVEKKLSVETTNYRRWQGYWVKQYEMREYAHGLLIVDIVNRVTKNVVWRGWASGFGSQSSESQDEVNEIVKKMLIGFPPS